MCSNSVIVHFHLILFRITFVYFFFGEIIIFTTTLFIIDKLALVKLIAFPLKSSLSLKKQIISLVRSCRCSTCFFFFFFACLPSALLYTLLKYQRANIISLFRRPKNMIYEIRIGLQKKTYLKRK